MKPNCPPKFKCSEKPAPYPHPHTTMLLILLFGSAHPLKPQTHIHGHRHTCAECLCFRLKRKQWQKENQKQMIMVMMIMMRGKDIKMMIKNCVNIYKIPIYKYVSKNGSVRCRCRHCRVNVKCLNRAKTNYLLYNGNTL